MPKINDTSYMVKTLVIYTYIRKFYQPFTAKEVRESLKKEDYKRWAKTRCLITHQPEKTIDGLLSVQVSNNSKRSSLNLPYLKRKNQFVRGAKKEIMLAHYFFDHDDETRNALLDDIEEIFWKLGEMVEVFYTSVPGSEALELNVGYLRDDNMQLYLDIHIFDTLSRFYHEQRGYLSNHVLI